MKTAAVVLVAALSGAPDTQSNLEYCKAGCLVVSVADWKTITDYIKTMQADVRWMQGELDRVKRNSRGMCT
jgi:hypothetical protein